MGELCARGPAAKADHIPVLEERVNTLSNQVILLISHFWDSANKLVEMAVPDDEVDQGSGRMGILHLTLVFIF